MIEPESGINIPLIYNNSKVGNIEFLKDEIFTIAIFLNRKDVQRLVESLL